MALPLSADTNFRLRMKLCLTLAFVLGASALGADISLNPVADAFVSAANPTINYGAAGALSVSASGSAKGEFDSLLRFDLAPAAASFDSTFGAGLWAIDSIKLKLTAAVPLHPIFNDSAAGPFAIQWMQNDSWSEGSGSPKAPHSTGITFSTPPKFRSMVGEALGIFPFSGATIGNNEWNLALTPLRGLAAENGYF